jgi:Rrf2 family protein
MKLSAKSEYALLALVYLARNSPNEFHRSKVIADEQSIPPKFLEHILLKLKQSNFVQSSIGKGGGYRLAKPASEISVAEIVRLFDGALAPTESVSKCFYETTPIHKEQKLVDIFREIRDFIADKLEHISIADVL